MKFKILAIVLLVFAVELSALPYSGGSGTSGDPWQISTTDDLIDLSNTSADWNNHFILTANIAFDANEQNVDWDGDGSADWDAQDQLGFSPIGNNSIKFTGSFDGQGYEISNLFINRSTLYVGFFGYIRVASIINLGLTDFEISGYLYSGGLSGSIAYSTITNCYTSGGIDGYVYTGGFAGAISYTTINNSSNSADVAGTGSYAAGFIGHNAESIINRCFNSGDVTSSGDYASGFFGANHASTVSNSYSTGDVTRSAGTGTNFSAFSSLTSSSTIENSYTTGSVTYDNSTDPIDKGFVIDIYGNNTFTNNFFDSEAGGQTSGTGATVKTTSEMKTVLTFSDETTVGLTTAWDFVNNPFDDAANNDYWTINNVDNNGYPALVWQGFDMAVAPTVTTSTITNITNTTADSGGDVTDDGGADISTLGVVWSTTSTPALTSNEDGHTSDTPGVGAFVSNINGLSPNQIYYARAYATNSFGTVYGNEVSFATIPTLGEWGLIALGSLTAMLGGWFVYRRFV